MKNYNFLDTKTRSHRIIKINNIRYFQKEYKDKGINIEKLINEEYLKGNELANLINYPRPLRFKKNKILYEYIDIKESLYDLLNNGIIDYQIIKQVGIFLKKIHTNKIIHGDLNTENIVLSKKKNLYFIDASFSKYSNDNRVIFRKKNIYQDISNFLIFLKWIRPISFKPWILLILNKRKLNLAAKFFLNTYFNNNPQNFNKRKNEKMENWFFSNYLKYIKENKNVFYRLIWSFLITFLISVNRWKHEL